MAIAMQPAINATPAVMMRERPKRFMRAPVNNDGTNMARMWLWITRAVSSSENPSMTCMLTGVAVMMNAIGHQGRHDGGYVGRLPYYQSQRPALTHGALRRRVRFPQEEKQNQVQEIDGSQDGKGAAVGALGQKIPGLSGDLRP